MTTIKVKDISGDVEHYVADRLEILDNGDLCIICGNQTTIYNADHVIYHTLDTSNPLEEPYAWKEAEYEHDNI